LRSFRRLLPSPTTANCSALFAFSSLIMVYIYASPAESVEVDMVDTLESTLRLFKLCRGTLVLKPYMGHVRNSTLGPLFRQEFGMLEFDERLVLFSLSDSSRHVVQNGVNNTSTPSHSQFQPIHSTNTGSGYFTAHNAIGRLQAIYFKEWSSS
jgi:hypothetical protein